MTRKIVKRSKLFSFPVKHLSTSGYKFIHFRFSYSSDPMFYIFHIAPWGVPGFGRIRRVHPVPQEGAKIHHKFIINFGKVYVTFHNAIKRSTCL